MRDADRTHRIDDHTAPRSRPHPSRTHQRWLLIEGEGVRDMRHATLSALARWWQGSPRRRRYEVIEEGAAGDWIYASLHSTDEAIAEVEVRSFLERFGIRCQTQAEPWAIAR